VLRFPEAETVVMARGDDDPLEIRLLESAHPLIGVECRGIEYGRINNPLFTRRKRLDAETDESDQLRAMG
jgi:hypothetical protein